MLQWIQSFSAWVQAWLSADAGLWGLALSAFVSATVLPGSSEVVMAALIAAYPDIWLQAFFAATTGNVLGCVLTYGMGWGGREGFERFQRVKVDLEHPRIQRLRRWGPPSLFLSFLPLVGDAMVLAAGWLRLPFWASLAWIAAGKAARYAVLLAALKGLLSLA